MQDLTVDDVYAIAAEVAQETITRFLSNLVKLVPSSSEVIDDIRDQQYAELQEYRQQRKGNPTPVAASKTTTSATKGNKPLILDESEEDIDPIEKENEDFFASVAHPTVNKLEESYTSSIDDALRSIPLEASNLSEAALEG